MGRSSCSHQPNSQATPFSESYSVIILPISCEGGQQVPGVVPDPVLRHRAPPICHVGIVSEGKDSRIWDFGRQQGLGPRINGILRRPCLFTVSGEAMYEHNARLKSS